MSTTNPWLNPLQRSYNQIRAKLIESLKLRVPEITDFSEGNIFMIVLSIFAAIAEVLHYYIDNMASETFFVTARRYSSVKKHAGLVDYHIRCAIPSQVDILLSISGGGTPVSSITIPAGTIFTSSEGKPYISTRSIVWEPGNYGVYIPVSQKEYKADIAFGVNTSDNIVIYLGSLGSGLSYVEGSMNLTLTHGGVPEQWLLVDTFAYSKPNSKHYMVELDDNYLPYVKFGNGLYGLKPPINSTITGSFYVTYGSSGNVDSGKLITVPSEITSLTTETLVCTNLEASTGGSDYENFSMIKDHLPLSIKTLGVAISKDDYEAIARLAPGVDKAYVDYICGKFISIYITPDGGGIASSGLCEDTYKFIIKRKVITTSINVYPTKVASIRIAATITGNKSYKETDISLQVIEALFNKYNYNTSGIAKPVRLSDLYSLLDDLSMVDFLNVTNLYLLPLFNKVGAVTHELNASIGITEVVNSITYMIRYSSSTGRFTLLRVNNTPTGITLSLGIPQTITIDGNSWGLTINAPLSGYYSDGDLWKFIIPKNNTDQVPADFTIPIFNDVNNISLTIIETV